MQWLDALFDKNNLLRVDQSQIVVLRALVLRLCFLTTSRSEPVPWIASSATAIDSCRSGYCRAFTRLEMAGLGNLPGQFTDQRSA